MPPFSVIFYIFLITGGFANDDDISTVPHIRQRRFSIISLAKKYLFDKILDLLIENKNKSEPEDPRANVESVTAHTSTDRRVGTEIKIVNVINNSPGYHPRTKIVDAPATTESESVATVIEDEIQIEEAENTANRTVPGLPHTSTDVENIATVIEDEIQIKEAKSTQSRAVPALTRTSTEDETVATVIEDGTQEDKAENKESTAMPTQAYTSTEDETVATVIEDRTQEDKAENKESTAMPTQAYTSTEDGTVATVIEDGT
ncbi:unnamed protein product, partial [Auanema sp. JU1783]